MSNIDKFITNNLVKELDNKVAEVVSGGQDLGQFAFDPADTVPAELQAVAFTPGGLIVTQPGDVIDLQTGRLIDLGAPGQAPAPGGAPGGAPAAQAPQAFDFSTFDFSSIPNF